MPVYVPKGREEGTFAVLEPGVYLAFVEKVEPGWGPTGVPYLKWTFIVEDEGVQGTTLFHNTSLADNAVAYPGSGLYALLNRTGIESALEDKDVPFEEFAVLVDELSSGARCKIVVGQYEYDGKPRNDCQEFFSESDVMPTGPGSAGMVDTEPPPAEEVEGPPGELPPDPGPEPEPPHSGQPGQTEELPPTPTPLPPEVTIGAQGGRTGRTPRRTPAPGTGGSGSRASRVTGRPDTSRRDRRPRPPAAEPPEI